MTRFYFVFSFFPKTASISFFGFLAVVSCYGKKGAAKVRRGVKKKKWKKKKKKKKEPSGNTLLACINIYLLLQGNSRWQEEKGK